MSDHKDHHLGEDLAAMAEDGRGLEPARYAELTQHAGGCRDCRIAIESAKAVLSAVDARGEVAPSPEFDRALFARLDAVDRKAAARADSAQASLFERIRELFTLPRAGLAFAAAAAIALFVVLAGPHTGPDASLPDAPALAALPAELVSDPEALALAEDLDLFRNLDVIEDLDVLDDLDVIESMDEAG